MKVLPLTAEHWPAVERIYTAGIATGHATFESAPPTWEAFDAARLPDQRLVAVDEDGTVLGWAAAVPVSDRCAYAGVIEHSVYVDPAAQGRGIGRTLLAALLVD
jgi:phosphinothricin acetyltransferase